MIGLWHLTQLAGILAALACLGDVGFRRFPWPIRLAFGQFLLLVYAFARTASTGVGLPGLVAWELWLPLVGACLWALHTRPTWRHPPVYLAAFGVLAGLLALRLPDLGTLSSDPDLHAFQTKAFLEVGRFTGFYPNSQIPDRYPGGFRILNLVWGRLTGWNAVMLVNMQPYLQAVIMALSAVFFFVRLVPRRRRRAYLALGVFCGLLIYLPAWGEGRQNNEGTARLAANGFLLLPLFAAWVGRRGRSPGLFALTGMTWPIALSFNPALILPLAVLTVAAFALLRPQRSAWAAFAFGALLFSGVVFATDPFLRTFGAIGVNQESHVTTPLAAVGGIDWLLLPAAILGGALGACALAGHSWSGVSGLAVGWASRGWTQTPARAVGLALWGIFLLGSETCIQILQRVIPRASLGPFLFYRYTEATADQIALAFAGAWMPFLLLTVRRVRGGVLILALLIVGLTLRAEENWRVGLRAMGRSPLGRVTPDAVALVRAAESVVPAGERVLLTGRIMEGPWESWVMPENASRAVAHYSNLSTAFYYGVDHSDFKAENYRRHVAEKIDREWLRARGVRWAIVQGADPRFARMPVELERGDVRLVRID